MILTKQIKSINDKTPNLIINNKEFEGVNVLSWHKKDTPYYDLSPYELKTDGKEIVSNHGGIIFENYWQSLKIYPEVSEQEIYCHFSRKGDSRYLWYKYPYEKHLSNDCILPEYYKWRENLWNCKKPIRYPNGFSGRSKCKFAVVNDERLGYIDYRKKVYFTEYRRLIREKESFKKLVKKLKTGKNLVIYEIDVPALSKNGNFKEVNDDGTYECTIEKLDVLLDSPEEAFGHGLALVYELLLQTSS
jgi:hypothetical protein